MLPFFLVPSHRRLCAVFLSLTMSLAAIAAESAQRNFNVPAGLAENTLKRFSEQAGVQVIFPTDRVQGIHTKAVNGEMEPASALEQMVAGTELVVIRDEKTGALGIRREASVERAEKNDSRVAQKAGDRPTPNNPGTDRQDGVIELSPFEVRADKDVGYESLNANSISGLNTSLVNVPVTAEIYNRQFMDDLGISSVEDTLLRWASGQSPNGKPGNSIQTPGEGVGNTPFVIRGVATGGTRWDGFMNGGFNFLDDTFQERTEVIRGPQSLLYGAAGATGIINVVSKQARLGRNSARLRVRLDDFGTKRAELDANVTSGSKFALRVATTQSRQEYYSDHLGLDVNSWYLAAALRPTQRVTLRVYGGDNSLDKARGQDANVNLPGDARNGQSLNLLLAQGNTAGLYFKDIDWTNVDSLAGQGVNFGYHTPLFGASADVALTDWLDMQTRIGYAGALDDGWNIANGGNVLSPTATGNTTGKWAVNGRIRQNGQYAVQRALRVLLNARFNLWRERIKNNLTVGFDASRQYQIALGGYRYYRVDGSGNFVVNTAQAGNADAGRTEMPVQLWTLEDDSVPNPFAGGLQEEFAFGGFTYRLAPQRLIGAVAPTAANPYGYNQIPNNNVTDDKGYYASLYSELFDNKVSLLAGMRRNYNYARSTVAPSVSPPTWATTWSAGAVWHFKEWLSPYYNYSLAYAPNGIGTTVSQDGRLPPVNNGVGTEVGLKFSIPRLKTTGSLALYRVSVVDRSIVLNNTLTGGQAIVDPNSAINGTHLSNNLIYFGDFTVQGVELSMTANPTRNWRARFSFSYNTDKIGNRVTLQRWYNDQFNTNAAGQVLFNNGSVAMVNSIAGNTSSPLVPLTIAMMKDPASGYFATLDTGSGRLVNLGGRTFTQLGLVGAASGLTIGTGTTGLPITQHQLGWVPPTQEFVVTDGGEHLAIPRSTASVTVTRSFTEGRLNGLTAGLTLVARLHQLAYYYNDAAAGNVRKAKTLPDQLNSNLFVSYRFKLKSKYNWTTQLNVSNVMNNRSLIYILNASSGVATNAKMDNVPRAFSWTNTIEF